MLKITYNQDKQIVDKILDALDKNNGYCPCKLEKNNDTKCMCKEFREQKEGYCHCGLYIKEDI
nr:MAG TPA: ferredoxin-thioredoxin reductase [Caudoviricetes sp.]DAU08682.1 MAG TPA: ferredoxin-thioredoxin reductase [Caudoviricetes sp.]